MSMIASIPSPTKGSLFTISIAEALRVTTGAGYVEEGPLMGMITLEYRANASRLVTGILDKMEEQRRMPLVYMVPDGSRVEILVGFSCLQLTPEEAQEILTKTTGIPVQKCSGPYDILLTAEVDLELRGALEAFSSHRLRDGSYLLTVRCAGIEVHHWTLRDIRTKKLPTSPADLLT